MTSLPPGKGGIEVMCGERNGGEGITPSAASAIAAVLKPPHATPLKMAPLGGAKVCNVGCWCMACAAQTITSPEERTHAEWWYPHESCKGTAAPWRGRGRGMVIPCKWRGVEG